VTRNSLAYRPISLEAEETFLEGFLQRETDVHVMIVIRETDRPIGTAALHLENTPHQARFGIAIGAKYEWGKGYGTEATGLILDYAFATLNLHRVWLHVFEYNEAGRRTYEKVGFRQEGVHRKSHFSEGRYWDTMAILQEEWQFRREVALTKEGLDGLGSTARPRGGCRLRYGVGGSRVAGRRRWLRAARVLG
jgi:RimJ/RimL family protein N-acetyltransferase